MKNVRILAIILIVAFVVVFSSVIVCNAETVASGECGENATWVLDETGKLIISGTGEMWDYSLSNKSPFSSTTKIQSVVIEDGVTSIGYHAFDNDYKITSITIPDSVTTIKYAFEGCSGLKTISIPGSVNNIDGNIFRYCSNMTSIDVDETNTSYKSIDGILYDYNCTRLIACPVKKSTISVPDSLITIEGYACYRCRELTSITLSDNVTTIGENAFYDCALTSITLPDSLTTIGEYAFSYNSLTSIQIPASVTFIGGHIVSGCSGMMSIDVDANNTKFCSIDGILYDKECRNLFECPANKDSVTIPDSVSHITQSAFANCNKLTGIVIPDTVTSIGGYAFVGCSSLTSIIIPDGIWYIQQSTFEGCSSLNSITIPESVTNIDVGAFRNCKSLADVYYKGDKNKWDSISIYSGNTAITETATIHFNSSGNTPVSWEWKKDSYCFRNTFGSGEPIYISDKDFEDFIKRIDKTDITRLANWYGEGPEGESFFITSIKLQHFLLNKLRIWDGSCYGMSLTAALFKEGIKDPIHYGGPTTFTLPEVTPGTNTPLESFLNVYHITQACSFTNNTRIEEYIGSDSFSSIADDMFEKASRINSGKQEVFPVDIWYDENGDKSSEEGHTVVCYDGESGDWTENDIICDRRLVVADPNLGSKSYIYISKDSQYMFYPYLPHHNGFGYNTASLSDLNTYNYNDSSFKQVTLLDILTGSGAVIKGNRSGGQVTIKDGVMTVLNESDDWQVDSLSEVCDADTGKEPNVTYRIIGDMEDLTIEPLEGEKLGVGIVVNGFAANINGDMSSAIIGSDGHVSLNDPQGQVIIDLARNDSELDFVQVHGDAKGDVAIDLDTDKISMNGEVAGYTVSDMDRDLNRAETTIQTNEETVIPADDLKPAEHECVHKWNTTYTVDKKATYAAAGSKSIHCAKCNAVKPGSAVSIPKLKVKGTTLLKVTAVKKGFKAKWKKKAGVSGYEIQYALNKKFTKGKKRVRIAKPGKVSKKVTKLKARKKYFVRIRTYKVYKGKKYYSAWSKAKKVKTKK